MTIGYRFIGKRRAEGHSLRQARVQALMAAIREGRMEVLRTLIQEGVELNPHRGHDYWPLWDACRAPSPNRVEVVKLLLEGGADPNLTIQQADSILVGVVDHFPGAQADLAPIAALLLDHGLTLEARDSIHRTALIAACSHGMLELVAVLLERGADVEASTGKPLHETPLKAAMRGDGRAPGRGRYQEVIELLLRHGADPGAMRSDDGGLLQHASQRGYLTLVRDQVDKGADVDLADRHLHLTALMKAAGEGHAEVVKLLTDRGAALDKKDYEGKEALARAAAEGHANVISILLDRGAHVGGRDRHGDTALLHAAPGGHLEAVERLLARGADVNETNDLGCSALMLAGENREVEVVRRLLSHGADVNAVDREGRTALDRLVQTMYVAPEHKETVEVAEALLAGGADPNRRDPAGCTPVAIASIVGAADLVQRLLDHRADPNAADMLGVTPLMQAVLYGRTEPAEWLLLYDADVNARTKSGQTALSLATDPAVVRLLEGAGAATTAASGPICAYAECPICGQLPNEAYADENRDGHLPPASARLLFLSSDWHARTCPYCGSRYELEDTADNSEFYPVYHLTRVRTGDR